MISYIVVFIVGAWVGVVVTVVALGLCKAAGDADERLGLK